MMKQEYLELLIKTSAEGGFPAIDYDGVCSYRAPDGRRCAVGLVIPDDVYSEDMEGDNVLDISDDYDLGELVEGVNLMQLHGLQKSHDSLASQETWDHNKFVASVREILGN